jgi:uncharacterized membrane protein HdeD (DUF308 family)
VSSSQLAGAALIGTGLVILFLLRGPLYSLIIVVLSLLGIFVGLLLIVVGAVLILGGTWMRRKVTWGWGSTSCPPLHDE